VCTPNGTYRAQPAKKFVASRHVANMIVPMLVFKHCQKKQHHQLIGRTYVRTNIEFELSE